MLLDCWLSGTDATFILLQRFSSPAQLMTHFLDVSHDVAKGDLDIDNFKGIAPYEYWHKNNDLWLHCGMLCSPSIKKLVSAEAGLNLSVKPSFRSTHTCHTSIVAHRATQ